MEGEKRIHQVLGEIEHVQRGIRIKRVALLDSVTHHLRFQALTDRMSSAEKEKLNGILQKVGAQDFGELHLKRDVKRHDYAYVLI